MSLGADVHGDIKFYVIVRSRPGGKAKGSEGPGGGDTGEQRELQQEKQQLQPQRRVKTLLPKIRRTSASQCEDDGSEKHVDTSPPPPPYTATVMSVSANKMETEMLEGEGWYESSCNRSIYLFFSEHYIVNGTEDWNIKER
jgi:hypothetical protein